MSGFEKSVFINCPLDEEYRPIFQAVFFCVIYLGFCPRVSTETISSFDVRIRKIQDLIRDSKYSIHDLSRCKSHKGEYSRLNMPLELGLDYGCKCYFGNDRAEKKGLVFEEEPHSYDKSISDFSGFDIQAHNGEAREALKRVRHWLSDETLGKTAGPERIWDSLSEFLGWHERELLRRGYSIDDIDDCPIGELTDDIKYWIETESKK